MNELEQFSVFLQQQKPGGQSLVIPTLGQAEKSMCKVIEGLIELE
jgi:hypothetical protein